jgi:hypothetical protein
MFNATFNNISVILWQSVLLVKETGENHRPVATNYVIRSEIGYRRDRMVVRFTTTCAISAYHY